MSSVIVFGPTGRVASIAALTAQEKGAQVYLAMRDPTKSIPNLDADQEQTRGFKRLQADLTKPDTVLAAVRTSGATKAFIYLAWGTPDHMKATVEALQSGGIEFVVFLSSYSVSGELSEVLPKNLIPYSHAQVEISLREVFGQDNFVALRPGGFAANMLRYKSGVQNGEVKIYAPDFTMDGITSVDMGRVAGTLLVRGSHGGNNAIYLYGPQIISQADAIRTIAEVLGKEIKITESTAEEAYDEYIGHGMPKPIVEYIMRVYVDAKDNGMGRSFYETGVENVQLYTGQPATTFKDWVADNKALFLA